MKKVRMITINGMRGIGKTRQAQLLNNYFKAKNIPTSMHVFIGEIEEDTRELQAILDRSKDDHDIVFICNGSIATGIEHEFYNNVHHVDILNKYNSLLHMYAVLTHKLNLINILLTIDNQEACQKRVDKRNELWGAPKEEIDIEREMAMVQGFKRFDEYMFALNMKFKVIETIEEEGALAIHDKIVKTIGV